MLKEKIPFKNELPVNVLTAEIDEYPIHFHDEIEVVFVLKGKVTMRNGYYTYVLKQGDIFILNDREIHSFSKYEDEENMVMMMQLDLSYFSGYYDNLKNSFFVTDMEDDADESLDVLRTTLAKIMMEVLQKGYGYEHKVIESTHNLISGLQSDFQYFLMEDGKFVNETKKKGNKVLAGRLNRITDYMYENYNRKLTLSEIADREHLSVYYLSHVIKEATGLSFQELLSFIRVEESEKLLLGTKKKIGAVSEESGFSAVRYYIKHFEHWFGMHPLEYRKEYTGKVSSRESKATLRRCMPGEIEEALRDQVKGLYQEYMAPKKGKSIIVEMDLNPKAIHQIDDTCKLDILLSKAAMKPVSEPYRILLSLGERRVSVSDNHIATVDLGLDGRVKGMTVLFYSYEDGLEHRVGSGGGLFPVSDEIVDYEDGVEFLLRTTGLSGEFLVSRYKMTKENALRACKQAGEGQDVPAKKALLNHWATRPTVEFETFQVVESLSLRSNLKGFSAELILLDKITEGK